MIGQDFDPWRTPDWVYWIGTIFFTICLVLAVVGLFTGDVKL